MRPLALEITTWLMAATNLMGYLLIDWKQPATIVIRQCIVFSILIAAGYVVLWFYWKGHNWARILVLLTCLLSLFNLTRLGHVRVGGQVMVIIEAAIAIFLLYWLNTAEARDFFRKGQNESAEKTTV